MKHLARRLIATRQKTLRPLSGVAHVHKVKTREQSLRLLEECHRKDTGAIPGALRFHDMFVYLVGLMAGTRATKMKH
jgi:hypothetical protein